jgi:hypothetical protein
MTTRLSLLPAIAFAVAACSSDTTTTGPISVPAGPQLATVINPANAPSGTHVQTGTPSCSLSGFTVTCSTYELGGVGNADATANLSANYTATIDCTNKGGQLVESHSHNATASASTGELSPKNGRLTVPQLSAAAPTNQQILRQASCPNPNWTPSVHEGSLTLTSFTYSLTFEGFTGSFITITGP